MMQRNMSSYDVYAMSTNNVINGIRYFEDGCLCIHSGDLPVRIDAELRDQLHHYLLNCVCSRHPDGELK